MMETQETVEIPKLAIQAVSKPGYWQVIKHFVQMGYTQKEAWIKTESLLEKFFNSHRYTTFDSFRHRLLVAKGLDKLSH